MWIERKVLLGAGSQDNQPLKILCPFGHFAQCLRLISAGRVRRQGKEKFPAEESQTKRINFTYCHQIRYLAIVKFKVVWFFYVVRKKEVEDIPGFPKASEPDS